MTDWTEAELGTLLVETFRSHEAEADPAHAARVAARTNTPHRWRAAILAAAAVALLIGSTAFLIRPASETERSLNTPTTTPTGPIVRTGTNAEYRALAQRESARILSLAKTPPGTTRLSGEPPGWPSSANLPLGLADERLTRTAWFSAPLDADQVEQYLLSHPPTGFTKKAPGLAQRQSGLRYFAYDTTTAPVDPSVVVFSRLLVLWHQQGDRTIVRFDTLMLGRLGRAAESVIPAGVSSVDIDRVRFNSSGVKNDVLPRRTVVEPATIARLVGAMNSLYGSPDAAFLGGGCGGFPGNPRPMFGLTFHTAGGTYSFRWETSCQGQITVARNGIDLPGPLDPGRVGRLIDAVAND